MNGYSLAQVAPRRRSFCIYRDTPRGRAVWNAKRELWLDNETSIEFWYARGSRYKTREAAESEAARINQAYYSNQQAAAAARGDG